MPLVYVSPRGSGERRPRCTRGWSSSCDEYARSLPSVNFLTRLRKTLTLTVKQGRRNRSGCGGSVRSHGPPSVGEELAPSAFHPPPVVAPACWQRPCRKLPPRPWPAPAPKGVTPRPPPPWFRLNRAWPGGRLSPPPPGACCRGTGRAGKGGGGGGRGGNENSRWAAGVATASPATASCAKGQTSRGQCWPRHA